MSIIKAIGMIVDAIDGIAKIAGAAGQLVGKARKSLRPPKAVPFNEKHQWENIDAGPPVVVLSKPYCVFCGDTRTPQNKDEKCLGPRAKVPS